MITLCVMNQWDLVRIQFRLGISEYLFTRLQQSMLQLKNKNIAKK